MIRRRSTPWIHRWSRLLIAAIAIVGACGTAYLTYLKFTGGTAACPTSGCERVLDSPYATVFGLPLTLFGFLGYDTMWILALAPLLLRSQPDLQKRVEEFTWPLMFWVSTAMAVFSAYLMYLLAFEIKLLCIYCIASALFTWSMLILTLVGRDWEDFGQILFQGFIVALIVFLGTLGVYSNLSATTASSGEVVLEPQGQPTPGKGWTITTSSGEAEIALAKHLKAIDAKEYIAWWCPHCHEQKQLFGKEAYEFVPHVQCAPDGENGDPKACEAAKIQSFPSWDIKGKRYMGVLSMAKIAEYSGYSGPSNFKYDFDQLKGLKPKPAPAIP